MKPTQPAEEELYPVPQDEVQSEEQFDAAPVNFDDDGEDPLKRHTKFSWKSFRCFSRDSDYFRAFLRCRDD